jgi:hypothetical protein
MSSQSIFERLQEAKNESKRIDELKSDMLILEEKVNECLVEVSNMNSKLNQLNDFVASRIRNDEFYELKSNVNDVRIKLNAQYEDLKKNVNTCDNKKLLEDLDEKLVSKNEFHHELDELKLCLEHYVKNAPSTLTNKDYEKRLLKIEERMSRPISVKSFK